MMPAILWKEYREHRNVWGALAFLGALIVLSPSVLLETAWVTGWVRTFPQTRETQNERFFSVVLVGLYALICGAMLLAGERENRTLPYLDGLPGWRRWLWLGKLFSGVVLVLGLVFFLMGLCAALLLFATWKEAALTLGGMMLVGLIELSWGMLFSSFGRSVMNVILLSFAGQVVVFYLTGMLASLVSGPLSAIYGAPSDETRVLLWYAFLAITALTALIGSALVFTRLDRNRLRAVPKSLPVQGRTLHPSWSMLFWLTWRQARGFAVGLTIFALFLGFVVLIQPLLLWPAATLLVGVLCGATAFADEQPGPFRFLGDQRLPLGRLWVVKVGIRFAIAVVAALVVLAPSLIAAVSHIFSYGSDYLGGRLIPQAFHASILVALCPPRLFLTLWLAYGFSAGCLFGLLFRHGLAAGLFALFVSSLTAALWIPSLLSGGLYAWQVFGPPVLVLVGTRLIMRPWAAGRVASWTTALRLTPFAVAAALWIAESLWYRVLEIPNVPSKFDLDAFRASLPEQDEGGRLFHSACLRFEDLRRTLETQQTPQAGAPGMVAGQAPVVGAPEGQPPALALASIEQVRDTLEHGWPAKDRELAAWMDKMYAGEWTTMLKKAAELPTGPFDDVRNMTFRDVIPATKNSRNVAVVLAVRGLQRQAAGDDAGYVENLRIGLALSRSLRDYTPAVDVTFGREVEGALLTGLDRWLEKLHGRPDLIRQALALQSRHLEETTDDDKDVEEITALLGKNTLENPASLVRQYVIHEREGPGPNRPRVEDEADWVAAAWLVPWERIRQERIFRVTFYGDKKQQRWLTARRNDFEPLPQFGPDNLIESLESTRNFLARPGERFDARVMQLKLALRWYQAENGKPTENLDELVPKYLPSLPLDPFDDKPFRYQLSRGEEIVLPPGPGPAVADRARLTQKVPAGQGVLWGESKDRVFLVPLPPTAK